MSSLHCSPTSVIPVYVLNCDKITVRMSQFVLIVRNFRVTVLKHLKIVPALQLLIY